MTVRTHISYIFRPGASCRERLLQKRHSRSTMEYGIWSLHAAGGLWGDPRLARRHPILPPGAPQMLPRAAFALSALQRPSEIAPLPLVAAGPPYRAMELVAKSSPVNEVDITKVPRDQDSRKSLDNENNIEKNREDENDNQTFVPSVNDNEENDDESDEGSTNSSRHSVNNNLPTKPTDPMSCLVLDKEETVTPVLNGWVLGAYTAMLGRLSAATAALEATEIPNVPSDSDSESDRSSYTEKLRFFCKVEGKQSKREYS